LKYTGPVKTMGKRSVANIVTHEGTKITISKFRIFKGYKNEDVLEWYDGKTYVARYAERTDGENTWKETTILDHGPARAFPAPEER
jgi:hypothetical protein